MTSVKRKRESSDAEEEDAGGKMMKTEDIPQTRTGRVRKKSAKLLEMEEGEMALASYESRNKNKKKQPKTPEAAEEKKTIVTVKTKQTAKTSVSNPAATQPEEEVMQLQSPTEELNSPAGEDQPIIKPEVPDIHLQVKEDPEEQGQETAGQSTGLKMKISLSGQEPAAVYFNQQEAAVQEDAESVGSSSGGEDDDVDNLTVEEVVDFEDEDEDDLGDEDDEDFDEDEMEEAAAGDVSVTKSSQALMDALSNAPGPSNMVKLEYDGSKSDSSPVYSNTQEMALKVKTSAEKKAAKSKRKAELPPTVTKTGRLKSKRPTAYTMFCREYREKVFAENPFISPSDFSQISRRLGEIWHTIPEKEKMAFKRKARVYAGRLKRALTAGALPKRKNEEVAQKNRHIKAGVIRNVQESIQSKINNQLALRYGGITVPEVVTEEGEETILSEGNTKIDPVDVAAYMTLLGNSLSIIGANLQKEMGASAVQGALSVLLDSLLSSLGPLMTLTKFVPKIDTIPQETHSKTLDNIAYIMPGM